MDLIDILQVEVYKKLSEAGYNVMDVPDINTPFPFIKLGDINTEILKDKKNIYGYNVSYILNIWTAQGDKQRTNYMVSHITELLLEIDLEGYEIIDINTTINYTDYEDARQTIITLSLSVDVKG